MKWFKHGLLAMIIAVFIVIDVQAATLRSDLVTNTNAVPPDMNNPNVDGGVIRRKRATYTFTGSEATGDVVEMVTIPFGSVIIREQSTIVWSDMGTTVVVEVGDTFDPDRYCSSLPMGQTSSGTVGTGSTSFLEAIGYGGTYTARAVGTSTGNDTIDLTLTTVSTPASADAVIQVEVVYVSTG